MVVNPVKLENTKAKKLYAGKLVIKEQEKPSADEITGMEAQLVEINDISMVENENTTEIDVKNALPSGAIAIFETTNQNCANEEEFTSGIAEAVESLSLLDLNVALYRCAEEEQDSTSIFKS